MSNNRYNLCRVVNRYYRIMWVNIHSSSQRKSGSYMCPYTDMSIYGHPYTCHAKKLQVGCACIWFIYGRMRPLSTVIYEPPNWKKKIEKEVVVYGYFWHIYGRPYMDVHIWTSIYVCTYRWARIGVFIYGWPYMITHIGTHLCKKIPSRIPNLLAPITPLYVHPYMYTPMWTHTWQPYMYTHICTSIYERPYMDTLYVCPYMDVHIWPFIYGHPYMNTRIWTHLYVHTYMPPP